MIYYILLITVSLFGSLFCQDETQASTVTTAIQGQTENASPVNASPVNPTAPVPSTAPTTSTDITQQTEGAIAPTPAPVAPVQAGIAPQVTEEGVEGQEAIEQPGNEDEELVQFRKYIEQYVSDGSESTNSINNNNNS